MSPGDIWALGGLRIRAVAPQKRNPVGKDLN